MLRKLTLVALGVGLCVASVAMSSDAPHPKFADLVDWDATYRETLERWAAGDATALLELGDFGRRHVHARNCIGVVPFSLAKELAQIDPEHVVPQILMHESVYLMHLHSGELAEATIHLDLHQEILDLYLERVVLDSGDGDRELIVRLFVVPAAFALQARDWRSLETAQKLLEGALDIDSEQVTALRFQAQLHELDGRFQRAAEVLERVVDVEPELRSSRLHLALARLRSGQETQGRRELQDLCDGSQDWVSELAFEELVREQVRLGELEAAAQTLAEGLERYPASSELWLQAAALDLRRGRQPPVPPEALVERWAAATEPSPRYLFDRGPFEAIDAYRARFSSAIEERNRNLRRALAYIDGSEVSRPTVWKIVGTHKLMGGCRGFLREAAP